MKIDRVATQPESDQLPQVLVIDLPRSTTAAEMASILDRHCDKYVLLSVLPWPGIGARAVLRKRVSVWRREQREAGLLRRYGHRDGKDGEAIAVVKANPDASTRQLSAILKIAGIARGKDWVSAQRKAIREA